jgi:Na+/H+ antiporter NhaD/arsenite permease-like protein
VPPSFFTPTVPFEYFTIGQFAFTKKISERVPKTSRKSVIFARRKEEEEERGEENHFCFLVVVVVVVVLIFLFVKPFGFELSLLKKERNKLN